MSKKIDPHVHQDYRLNFLFYQRFNWPEHSVSYEEQIVTCAIFTLKKKVKYQDYLEAEVNMSRVLNFHEPSEYFKKTCVEIAKEFGLVINESKTHVVYSNR